MYSREAVHCAPPIPHARSAYTDVLPERTLSTNDYDDSGVRRGGNVTQVSLHSPPHPRGVGLRLKPPTVSCVYMNRLHYFLPLFR